MMIDSTCGHVHYGTLGPMPQQPKFIIKDCVWESAKDPQNTFCTWLCIFGGIVANYNVGPQLEMFLAIDLFLLRDPQAATTQPSFLTEPSHQGSGLRRRVGNAKIKTVFN